MLNYQFIKKYQDESSGQINQAEIDYDNDRIRIERRLFNIRTYDGLRRSNWRNIEPANRFIQENFDFDEYDRLVRLFVNSRRELVNAKTGSDVVNAVVIIDGYVYKLFKKLSLPDRIFSFVCSDKNISLPDFAGIGERPQDTPEKTFYEEDYHLINTITIISKILCPLFGEIINRIKLINDSYKSMKEIVAFGAVNTLLREEFGPIISKLQNYIGKTIERFLTDDPMVTFNGITATSLTNYQFAKIIVKNFANHNLYEPDGNVVRAVCVTLKRSIENETKGSSKQLTYRERLIPESTDDDQNISLLENSINTVSEPVEVPVLVAAAINQFINNYIVNNGIDTVRFGEIVRYYTVTIIQPTPINELIVAMFISDPIGSAYCVKYMDMDMMIKIISIIQLYALTQGFEAIVPLLSMTPTNVIKTEPTDIDNRIILNNGRGNQPNAVNYFVSLTESISHIRDWNGFNFMEYMKSITAYLVESIHHYNVAPGILSIRDTGATYKDKQDMLRYDENIIAELHRFMYHLLHNADKKRALT